MSEKGLVMAQARPYGSSAAVNRGWRISIRITPVAAAEMSTTSYGLS